MIHAERLESAPDAGGSEGDRADPTTRSSFPRAIPDPYLPEPSTTPGVSSRHARDDALVLACVIDDLRTGGAQRLVSVIARELADHDVRLVVISLGARDEMRETLLESGVEVHLLPASKLTSPRRLLGLIRLLRAIGPDLVHTHLLAAHIVGGVAARVLRLPLVATLHNVDPHPRFAGSWKRRAETLCLRLLASRLIAVGPSVAASNASRLGGRRIDVMPNPLSMPIEEEAPGTGERVARPSREECRARVRALVGSTAETVHFLTVGRLAAEKGWPGFLDVFDRLRATHPDIRLIAVGDGPCAGPLGEEIARRGLDEHVHLVGRSDDVRTFYLGSDVFVLNSTIEGLPMALLEAMAAGLPVVSTRVGDVEHAAPEDVATLVDPGRGDEMVDALRGVLAGREEATERAREARRRVLASFDPARWAEGLLERYRSEIDRGGRRRGARGATRPERTGALHIVEIIDGLNAGGAQSLVALRARNAARMGYRIDVVSLGTDTTVPPWASESVDAVDTFPSPHVFDLGRILRICALLRERRPDVIHTHLRTSNIVGALCGRLTGIPVVGTLHNVFPELGLEHARRDWAEKWALRLGAARVVAVGPRVASTHQPRLGDKRIATIPNPVELPSGRSDATTRRARARTALGLPFDADDARIVLVVSRLTRVKGVLDAVRALERLTEQAASRGSAAPKLLIAGHGELEEELRRYIEREGLGESVFLLGRSERVRELMAASDALLLCSRVEGLPLVLLEAMSMRLPVVASRVGDVPWLLEDGELGELVEPGDIDGIAEALGRTLDLTGDARDSLADRAFERVREGFSAERWLLDIDRELRGSDAPADRDETESGEPNAPPVRNAGDADRRRDSTSRSH